MREMQLLPMPLSDKDRDMLKFILSLMTDQDGSKKT
jgi:hypothetical protein